MKKLFLSFFLWAFAFSINVSARESSDAFFCQASEKDSHFVLVSSMGENSYIMRIKGSDWSNNEGEYLVCDQKDTEENIFEYECQEKESQIVQGILHVTLKDNDSQSPGQGIFYSQENLDIPNYVNCEWGQFTPMNEKFEEAR